MSYQPTAYEVALQTWLQGAVGANVPVIYARQSAPPPPGSFVTLQVTSLRPVGTPSAHITDEETAPGSGLYRGQLRHEYRGSADVNVFGSNHKDLAAVIERSLWLPATLAGQAEHTRPMAVSQLADASAVVGAEWEGRSLLEVSFSHATTTDYDAEAVSTVAATYEEVI